MILGIITDIHNNLPALQAIMARLRFSGCDKTICCGDIIGIGPYPEETVRYMMQIPNLIAVRGNHETYLLEGMPDKYPNLENMHTSEMEHHKWEHQLLSKESVAFLRNLPYRIDMVLEGFSISVLHSCMDEAGRFSKSKKNPSASDPKNLFANIDSDILLYGHDHSRNIHIGSKCYINVGSLGCPSPEQNIARAGILSIENGKMDVDTIDVIYDADEVVRRIDTLKYPDAENIKRYFYSR